MRALFEIDKDVSPKHYAGGVALANVVALRTGSAFRFFSIVPFKHRGRAARTLQLFERHLGDKWILRSTIIPTLIPSEIAVLVSRSMHGKSGA
jgi:hypothetical protein